MKSTACPSYHEELAAHLDTQATPKPHPPACDREGCGNCAAKADPILYRAQAALLLSQAKLNEARLRAMGLDLPQPTQPFAASDRLEEDEGVDDFVRSMKWHGRVLFAVLAGSALLVITGLVRGCAS